MTMPQPPAACELLVRSLTPAGSPDAVYTVRDRLKACGYEDIPIHVLGNRVLVAEQSHAGELPPAINDLLTAIQNWEASTAYSLEPFFTPETIHAEVIGFTRERLVVPTVALLEWTDGTLEFVSPCRHDERRISVIDRIEVLEDARPDKREVIPG